MPILRYIHIFLILLYPYPALFCPGLRKLILEFCTAVKKKDPSKETTSLHSANGKTVEISTSPRKVAMQSADVTSCQLEVH